MPDPESRTPDGSIATSTSDAGSETRETAEARAAVREERPDYDQRERGISERRKPMGPTLKEEEAAEGEALAERPDEDPADPA